MGAVKDYLLERQAEKCECTRDFDGILHLCDGCKEEAEEAAREYIEFYEQGEEL